MKVRSLVLTLALLLPASALADPITAGGSWVGTNTVITDPSQGGVTVAPFTRETLTLLLEVRELDVHWMVWDDPTVHD